MPFRPARIGALLAALLLSSPAFAETLRLGYLPNVTQVQALVGIETGLFAEALTGVKIAPKVFNGGPSVIEALFAGEIDFGYVGPGPAINGYLRSRGRAFKVVAGAASGGAGFIVRPQAQISSAADLAGKKIATPQLGNTQDIALRHYLKGHGLSTRERGGTVQVIPIANPDILNLFKRGDIDGAWVPEPWGTRLIRETNGLLFLDERDLWPNRKFSSALLVAATPLLHNRPATAKAFIAAHLKATRWVLDHPSEAKRVVGAAIQRITGKALPPETIDEAFGRFTPTADPLEESVREIAGRAYALGFLGRTPPDLSGLFELDLLKGLQ